DIENLKLYPLFLYDPAGQLLFAPKRLGRFRPNEPDADERTAVIRELGMLVPQVQSASEGHQLYTVMDDSYLGKKLDAGATDSKILFLRLKGRSLFDLHGLLLDQTVGWWIAFIGLIIGFLCFWLTRSLVNPIMELQQASRTIAEGRFHARLPQELTSRFDELGALAADFNSMADRIEATVKDQKQLLWDVSHELRTPLTRIGIALELIRQAKPEKREQVIGKMEKNVGRLNRLLQQILEFSRLGEHADVIVEKQPVALGQLIGTLVDDVRFEADSSGKTITAVLGSRDIVVEGSEELLRRAIENVLLNAIRHTPAGTCISAALNVDDASGNAVVKIADSGGGVAAEELPRLFTPFYRGAGKGEEVPEGIGLGLAIVQRAVQAHGGKVTAR
ncbi:MAG TPA: HAMP domain-containing sensor histidine kinase, partial [Candidatus Ozemobacteraceae bacterium]|nr:HAMP domain-containing sensor histidine kinase [Candidatus Ozemobacteraceae bacterium]